VSRPCQRLAANTKARPSKERCEDLYIKPQIEYFGSTSFWQSEAKFVDFYQNSSMQQRASNGGWRASDGCPVRVIHSPEPWTRVVVSLIRPLSRSIMVAFTWKGNGTPAAQLS
jgi:hypothetical protein